MLGRAFRPGARGAPAGTSEQAVAVGLRALAKVVLDPSGINKPAALAKTRHNLAKVAAFVGQSWGLPGRQGIAYPVTISKLRASSKKVVW